ncbi:NYN domain-containing protein [Arenimonas composti]|uniref:HTH OST-type domain-containing protein n=1 Tax=Arenimonas composti TR7-09 = DSM 18010 TaxID=1121013 RepID=A0A091BD23_9GAMM|nr:NYN domain-containing protein [Arenimonas composti]KFN48734.1 hypothetical protein P873_13840 [Arenimonas composti TR7-09 = DSM 18010]
MKNRNESDDDACRLAVLIDADNAQPAVIDGLLAEVARYGVASVKRIYGDFTSQRLQGWKSVLLDHSIQPMQQFAYTSGKNATDSSLIIDAMDLMYTRRFDGFCLVSSDSDFTRLAQRLREEGLKVYGFGERKTPDAFVQACDKFIYTEVLRPRAASGAAAKPKGDGGRPEPAKQDARAEAKPAGKPAKASKAAKKPAQKTQPQGGPVKPGSVGDIAAAAAKPAALSEQTVLDAPSPEPSAPLPIPRALLEQAIDECGDDQGWAHLGAVGSYLNKLRPDFDTRLYGHRKLSDLIRARPDWFEVQERGDGQNKSLHVRVR